jgi:hypothetical protein
VVVQLEQIQFLLGLALVQTTERYLGCKQNLGSPVNDRFKLRTEVQQQEPNFESAVVKRSTPLETAFREDMQCHNGGHEDEQPVEPNPPSPPERADLVEIRKNHRPRSLRRSSGPEASRSDPGSKANGQRDPEVVGSVGFGHHLTQRHKEIDRKYESVDQKVKDTLTRTCHTRAA